MLIKNRWKGRKYAFWLGAATGAAGTVVFSALGEVLNKTQIGKKAINAFNKKFPNNWLNKFSEKSVEFIGKHQVHLKNQKLEEILNPCSVYEAAKTATECLPNSPIPNKAAGIKREKEVLKQLKNNYTDKDGYEILSERNLLDKNGNIVKDSNTGKGRHIDFVVIKDGKAVDSIEVTSLTADKTAQLAKESRIRVSGGNYIKDCKGNLIEITTDIKTTIKRVA